MSKKLDSRHLHRGLRTFFEAQPENPLWLTPIDPGLRGLPCGSGDTALETQTAPGAQG